MSWFNLNDSLSSIKGQISNFANDVLADNVDNTGNFAFIDEYIRIFTTMTTAKSSA